MGKHHEYGERVLRRAVGGLFVGAGSELSFLSNGGRETVDGCIGGRIAIEIEARNKTQVRGAVDKLLRHPYARKLLVLMIPNLGCTTIDGIRAFENECRQRLQDAVGVERCRVVVLSGCGDNEALETDVECIRTTIAEWIEDPNDCQK